MITDYEDGHREVLLFLTPTQVQEAMAKKAREFEERTIREMQVGPQSRIEDLLIGEMQARQRFGVDQPEERGSDAVTGDFRNRKQRRKDVALARRSKR